MMAVNRGKSLNAGPAAGEDELVDRIAAAALDQFAEYGIRRSTIDDIARRAGVSKMTVFRRFQNKQGLIEVVIAREIRRGMAELDRAWEWQDTLEGALVQGFEFVAHFVRGHPLFDRLLRSEPEVLLPLMTVDGAPVLGLYRSLIAATAARRGKRRPCGISRHRSCGGGHRPARAVAAAHP